jgi:nucleotide-binding universal stress UspA family protein
MDTGRHSAQVSPDEPWVVVAVRPGLDCSAALRFAAYEALDRNCAVHLLHVLAPLDAGLVPRQVSAPEVHGARQAGEDALDHAARWLRALLGESWPVSTEFAHGSVERALAEAARGAQLLVLQQEPTDHVPSPLLDVLAGRAQAPLVVVPASWQGEDRSSTGLVVVGVEDAHADAEVVRWALASAERSGARVRIVHTWWSSDLYDQPGEERWPGWDQAGELRANLERELYDAVAGVTTVPVEVVVEHGDPRWVLADLSALADLVVLGRRATDTGRLHLGPVAKAVVHASTCPAVVVATRLTTHQPTAPDAAVGRGRPS